MTSFVSPSPVPVARRARRQRRAWCECRQQQKQGEASEWNAERLGFTEIGVVLGAHGVHGDVRVRSSGDFGVARLTGSGVRHLLRPGRIYPRPVDMTRGRRAPQSGVWLLRLTGAGSREAARSMAGSRMYIRDGECASADENVGLSAGALVGLRVMHQGEAIGVVRTVHFAADVGTKASKLGSDTLEVAMGADVADVFAALNRTAPCDVRALEEHTCVLVPFVRQIVPIVDVDGGFIEIDPPPGLLDATVVNRSKKRRRPRALLCAAREEHSSSEGE